MDWSHHWRKNTDEIVKIKFPFALQAKEQENFWTYWPLHQFSAYWHPTFVPHGTSLQIHNWVNCRLSNKQIIQRRWILMAHFSLVTAGITKKHHSISVKKLGFNLSTPQNADHHCVSFLEKWIIKWQQNNKPFPNQVQLLVWGQCKQLRNLLHSLSYIRMVLVVWRFCNLPTQHWATPTLSTLQSIVTHWVHHHLFEHYFSTIISCWGHILQSNKVHLWQLWCQFSCHVEGTHLSIHEKGKGWYQMALFPFIPYLINCIVSLSSKESRVSIQRRDWSLIF